MPLSAFTNIFAGNPIDRASDRRNNSEWLKTQFNDQRSIAIALRDGAPLVKASQDNGTQLAYFPISLASKIPDVKERWLFLGLLEKVAVFAFDVDISADPDEDFLQTFGRFDGLRELAMRLSPADAAIAATAKAVFEWQRRHRYCSMCGQPSRLADGGWKRVCSACATEHFPRTDPVVIMLPTRGDKCLLGRQAAWPAGMWSALAGFLEPGETIEEACARELREEAALETLSVHYHSSQPWPYPSSLMIGLIAEVAEGEAVADLVEIEALRWFTREQVTNLLAGKIEGAFAPSYFAIAHTLLKVWSES